MGITLRPWISWVGTDELLGVYVGMILISEGLMTMAISIFIRELKYWWIPVMEGLVSLLSAAIILLDRERSEVVTFVIGGWSIFKALMDLIEDITFIEMVNGLLFYHSRNQPYYPEFLWFKKPRTKSIRWRAMINQIT